MARTSLIPAMLGSIAAATITMVLTRASSTVTTTVGRTVTTITGSVRRAMLRNLLSGAGAPAIETED